MADDPIEIELSPDDDAKLAGSEVEVEKKPDGSNETEAALADLRRQIEESKQREAQERAARAEAERRAREASEKVSHAESEVLDSRVGLIQNAIRAASTEADVAERDYAEAMQAADYAAAAKAQRRMADASARLLQLENGKAELERQLPKTAEGAVREPIQRQEGDQFENWTRTLSAPSAAWAREHRALFNDPATVNKIGAAHNAATALEGLSPDTPEYFAFIEGKLGLSRQDAPKTEARRSMPSAPVSSSSSVSGTRGQSNRITLSSAEVDVAHSLFPDDAPHDAERKYAINKLALMKEGKLS